MELDLPSPVPKPTIEPSLGTTPFKKFIKLMAPLLTKYPELKFTDGYCFGNPKYVQDDGEIDTAMGGGDSNYHYRDLDPDTEIIITAHGFRVDDTKQFPFGRPAKCPVPFKTLGELADYQAKNRLHILADCKIEELAPSYSGFGDMPRYFARLEDGIQLNTFASFEDPHDDSTLISPDHPVSVQPSGTIEIKDLPDDFGFGGEEFTFLLPVENVWADLIKKG